MIQAQVKKADFSGRWRFNEEKSNFEEGRGFRSIGHLTVKQTDNKLSVDKQRIKLNGESTIITEKFTLNGKVCINNSDREGQCKTIVTWSTDMKRLYFDITRTFDWTGQTTSLRSAEEWSLIDSKTLSILSSLTMQVGEKKAMLVYDKE